MSSKYVSLSVIKRLPRYYRFLNYLISDGIVRISSRDLANRMGLSASQIRQDLNNFGGFGQQGYGYNTESLREEIAKIIGIDNSFNAVLVGVGNLGRTIATQIDYPKHGFDLVGIFDVDPNVIGTEVNGMKVRSSEELEAFVKENNVSAAILCIPSSQTEPVVDLLVNCGIKGFWNFTHYDIESKYLNIPTVNVHLNDSLMTLCYQISHADS